MKRIIIIFLFIFLLAPSVYSKTVDDILNDNNKNVVKESYQLKGQLEYDDVPVETIYLDDEVKKPQINIPKRSLTLPVKMLNITSNTNNVRSALARSAINRNSLTDILPLSGKLTESTGGFSYGQTWGQEISYSQIEDTTSFFLRYDTPRFLSLTGAIRQSANQDIGKQYNMLRLTPELHITKRLTLKDSFTNYINLPKNKNELSIVYTPELKKYADALKFELGIAQSYYTSGKQSSEIHFFTGFKL